MDHTHLRDWVFSIKGNFTTHHLLGSISLVLDLHLAWCRMEDQRLIVTILSLCLMEVDITQIHWWCRLISQDGWDHWNRLTKRKEPMDKVWHGAIRKLSSKITRITRSWQKINILNCNMMARTHSIIIQAEARRLKWA